MREANKLLQRQAPAEVPPLHILPEYAADGQRAAWYADMRAVLQVPWAGVLILAWTHYPRFFEVLWSGLRPLCLSEAFVATAREARAMVEGRVAGLSPPPIAKRLRDLGYGARETAEIRRLNEIFSHGNHLYAVIATVTRRLLEGGELGGPAEAPPYRGRHAPDVDVPLVLMEAHHADAPTRALYDDVKAKLGLPFVNTDYRAFARWPSYWAAAWGDLREVVGSPEHAAICQAYHDLLVEAAAARLPNPGGLTASALQEAAAADAPLEALRDEVRLFQWLLSGLATNVAYLRAQLQEHGQSD